MDFLQPAGRTIFSCRLDMKCIRDTTTKAQQMTDILYVPEELLVIFDRTFSSRQQVSDGKGGATWMACTFKFEAGKPHEDPVDKEAWIFVLRAEYLED